MNQRRILYEDRDMIVCHKAAGIATQTSRIGQADMVSEVVNYLTGAPHGGTPGRGGNTAKQGRTGGIPYVGVVHRLDQPVEGILVFAKNKNAAAALSRQMAGQEAEKYYYAIICGQTFAREGELEDYLLKDGRTNLSSVVPREVKDARRASLYYEILEEKPVIPKTDAEKSSHAFGEGLEKYRIGLARIRLYTGRHHQIRVQMSHAGMSLLGDHKYACDEAGRISEQLHVRTIALCAYKLSVLHPVTGERMQFQIRPEGSCFSGEEWQNL